MNNEKQRIAIAEACGWTDIKRGPYDGSPFGRRKTHQLEMVPDYLTDLNAMHQAEMVLSRGEHYNQTGGFGLYVQTLEKALCGRRYLIDATAAQRAEAFLRTLGKWEAEA